MSLHEFEDTPQWYKDAVIYELHVRAFNDNSGDGIGDFKGLTERLDYLEDLGVTAIWLLPFYPSPLKDDGYDISDYFKIHRDYGTLRDFKIFLRAAHKRGLRVITELVMNHTSNEHAWFQKARKAKPGSKMRDWYVWSDNPEKYGDTRIIFKDFETSNWTWDPVAGAYYWHRFYSHQPDLNYENPSVRREMKRVLDFWFSLGVDGLRIDAVPYLFEREHTNCENLPETHTFLKELRSYVDKKYKNRMLLAEANQWPEDAASYFGNGDECHMAFHFPVMPRIFMAVQMEDNYPIIDILNATPPIPDGCQWAIFLRNHDELTLEMVTDEERDYMYRLYAKDPRAKINVGIRRRLAPLLSNNRRKIELLNVLLFSLPGTPVIYYGDELGMGDNYYLGDRNGVRTPMQWSTDRNAGFSKSNPHQLYLPVIIDPSYHYEAINVENQSGNLSSILWWMKRMIAMRKQMKSLSRGDLKIVASDNNKVLSFVRRHEDEIVVVAINLSRFSQVANLDLSEFAGYTGTEAFSNNEFPPIKKKPYTLMFGPHSHFWLLLEKKKKNHLKGPDQKIVSELSVKAHWENILKGRLKERFEQTVIKPYLGSCRWFSSKTKTIRKVKIIEDINLEGPDASHLLFIEVYYYDGEQEIYQLPITFIPKETGTVLEEDAPISIIAYITVDKREGILIDSTHDGNFRNTLFAFLAKKKKLQGKAGEFAAFSNTGTKRFLQETGENLSSILLSREQSNTSLIYNKNYILKLYRKIDEGKNPEFEIIRYISRNTTFAHIPLFCGGIEYRHKSGAVSTLALLQEYIDNTGDAWSYMQDTAKQYFDCILSQKEDLAAPPQEYPSLFDTTLKDIPSNIREFIGDICIEMISLLGKRTAELHLSLASLDANSDFIPENFSILYQRSLYQSMQDRIAKTFRLLKKNVATLPASSVKVAESVIASQNKCIDKTRKILQKKMSGKKIRIHGDYHLGQVLYAKKDFIIIDFEGEPARPLSERRLKHSPFKDVAGLIRSIHYTAHAAISSRSSVRPEDIEYLTQWIKPWHHYLSGIYLNAYLEGMSKTDLIPNQRSERELLLYIYLLEKAIYELGYEMNNRPDWVSIPLKGIEDLIKGK
ncbi:MAG: maltose alpha-D-glucosyltransferase [Candidatus Ancaeobacter aquaticus]|nr:maltose alpha-D-glucosyltransferase [Candidatus Ancaeobacter aquaticus]